MTSRRTLSQTVMWLILAATVSLAAMVDRRVEQANHIELSAPIVAKRISFCLPVGWIPIDVDSRYVIAAVKEPDIPGRALAIFAQRVPNVQSEEEYLHAAGFIDFDLDVGWGERSIAFGDRKGILLRGIYNERSLVFLACAKMRNGAFVTLRIDGGEEVGNTEKLIRLIAQTVHTVVQSNPV